MPDERRGGGIVYAFEPSPYIIKNYLSVTKKNNPNIEICEYALSDKNGEAKLSNFDYNSLSNFATGKLVASKHDINHDCSRVDEFLVKTITLDEFVNANNLSRVNFIKADIEGAERYMIMGARRVLKEFAPKISICTYHEKDDPAVLRELILDANPNYVIGEKYMKMYAYVP